MALRSTLELDEKLYDVLDLDYEFSLSYDNNFKPSNNAVNGGLINFTILSPIFDNLVFHNWLLKKLRKSGKFVLPISHITAHGMKWYQFADAYCVRLSEHYNKSNSSQMYMRITISASSITVIGEKCEETLYNKNFPPPEKKR